MSEDRIRDVKWSVPLWLSAVVTVGMLAIVLHSSFATPLNNFFDDSLMFYRYAMNIRHGLGISWNLDGVHTYGCTSLTWLAIVLLFSFLPMMPIKLLMLASLLTWFAALAVLVLWMRRTAVSTFLRSPGNTLLLLAVPLELNLGLQRNTMNGMDTMLSFLTHILIAICALRFVRNQTTANALLCAGLGLFAYETRPESILCAALVPALLWLFTRQGRSLSAIALLLGGQAALLVLAALAARWYFGSLVPLAFYVKSSHGYIGYTGYHGPAAYAVYFFSYIALPAAAILLLMRRQDKPMLLAFAIPAALSFLYLCTVLQIMGNWGRYFLPYAAYLIVAALLLIDRALATKEQLSIRHLGLRASLASLVIMLSTAATGSDLASAISSRFENATHHPVPLPTQVMQATTALPDLGNSGFLAITSDVAARLPAGSSIAATEVGYLGAFAPHLSVIDLSGLNDPDIARNGFSMPRLLARRPDVIWLPQTDYTGMVAAILSDPHLLEQYDYYANAYSYGIAVRKDSPAHDTVLQSMAASWPERYPDSSMSAYKVKAIVPSVGTGKL